MTAWCSWHRHGLSGTPEYRTWAQMMTRCRNPNSTRYENWGGRGITVCERWERPENFIADMGPKPSPQHSIHRIDNNRGYEPNNCIWATAEDQAKNRRAKTKRTVKDAAPPRAQNAQIVVRTKPDLLDAIDRWRAAQADLPSRAEALRRFAANALAGEIG